MNYTLSRSVVIITSDLKSLDIEHRHISTTRHLNKKPHRLTTTSIPTFPSRGNIPSKGGRPYRRGRPCASCGQRCHRARLCTNSCPSADLWANCGELRRVWPEWLCDSSTEEGRVRAKRCAATCGCEGMVHDWGVVDRGAVVLGRCVCMERGSVWCLLCLVMRAEWVEGFGCLILRWTIGSNYWFIDGWLWINIL